MVAHRLLDINPDLDLLPLNKFLDPESAANLVRGEHSLVIGEHPTASASGDIHLDTSAGSSSSTAPSGSESPTSLPTGYDGSPGIWERRGLDESSEEIPDTYAGPSMSPAGRSHAGGDLGTMRQIPVTRPYDYVIDCIGTIRVANKLFMGW